LDAELLSRIRGQDLASCSDSDLRGALKRSAAANGPEEALPVVFALVDEAVSRRLGAWRLFDPDYDLRAMSLFRELANRVLESAPYRSQVGYYTEDAFLDSAAFRDSLDPMLCQMALDPDERTIVSAMVYVAERRVTQYDSEVLLPPEFYRALWAKDTENVLPFRVTDEQLLAGRLLYQGRVVEMNAGEGKTIAAAFPAVLHAVLGRRVHVITANDYLASRDADWLAPVYESLGVGVRAVLGHMNDEDRKGAYRSQIVYGTLREFGFDFLRDNLRYSTDELVQGPLDVAIVDEADQALIDEARTPLIIAGGTPGNGRSVHKVRRAVQELMALQGRTILALEETLRAPGLGTKERRATLATLQLADPENGLLVQQMAADTRLRRRVRALAYAGEIDDPQNSVASGLHYVVDPQREQVALTEAGQDLLERRLGPSFDTLGLELQLRLNESGERETPLAERRRACDRLRRRLARQHNQMNLVHQMLRACILLKRDVDYIVTDREVVLIDRGTGRRRPDSRYQHGLQAALEAKEGVTVHPEPEALAQISAQGLMTQYSHIAGMTGTALAARDDFRRAYGLDVVALPPTQPSRRTDHLTRLYTFRQDKLLAVLDEVRLCRRVGRPVLVGTLTVKQSEEISRLLERDGVEHRLLNAVNNAEEAQVVRSAGDFGAVTVATNMAGRGTDIVLEPGLDRRITRRYVALVEELLSGGAERVVLGCASAEEAGILSSALGGVDGLSVESMEGDRDTQVVVTSNSANGNGEKAVRLEFGLGLYVIGTEMNDSSRIDRQLRGRGGRQGETGSSRFILSLEDPAMVHGAHSPSPKSREWQRDTSGRAFLEGERTDRGLGGVQADAEMEEQVGRGVISDYDQVIERQTLSYYRARREVLGSDSFHTVCLELTGERARRLVDKHMPPALIGSYAARFEAISEELWLDYRVDCQSLWGLGAEALKAGLEQMMTARLETVRAAHGGPGFEVIEKLLFLQTGDELWADHLARLQDMMLSTGLCVDGHKAAAARYLFQSIELFQHLREEVIDAFLPRLVAFQSPGAGSPEPAEVSIVEDIHEILV
jgi:preprotein translocase subunit SecA